MLAPSRPGLAQIAFEMKTEPLSDLLAAQVVASTLDFEPIQLEFDEGVLYHRLAASRNDAATLERCTEPVAEARFAVVPIQAVQANATRELTTPPDASAKAVVRGETIKPRANVDPYILQGKRLLYPFQFISQMHTVPLQQRGEFADVTLFQQTQDDVWLDRDKEHTALLFKHSSVILPHTSEVLPVRLVRHDPS
jgi:hypothetical protein